jgi:hypothetical protein
MTEVLAFLAHMNINTGESYPDFWNDLQSRFLGNPYGSDNYNVINPTLSDGFIDSFETSTDHMHPYPNMEIMEEIEGFSALDPEFKLAEEIFYSEPKRDLAWKKFDILQTAIYGITNEDLESYFIELKRGSHVNLKLLARKVCDLEENKPTQMRLCPGAEGSMYSIYGTATINELIQLAYKERWSFEKTMCVLCKLAQHRNYSEAADTPVREYVTIALGYI